jgi:hypothetical protein
MEHLWPDVLVVQDVLIKLLLTKLESKPHSLHDTSIESIHLMEMKIGLI